MLSVEGKLSQRGGEFYLGRKVLSVVGITTAEAQKYENSWEGVTWESLEGVVWRPIAFYMHTKFELSSFGCFRDIERVPKIQK